MFGPPVARPKANPKISADRAARRQELAKIIEAKQQQLTRVRTEHAGRQAPGREQDASAVRTAEDCTARPPVRLVRNKENQQPREQVKSYILKAKAGYPSHQTTAPACPLSATDKSRERANAEPKKLPKIDEDDITPLPLNDPTPQNCPEDVLEIEEMYNFDLNKVEEMVKKEMEDMYSSDMAKVEKAEVDKPEVSSPEVPDPACASEKFDKIVAESSEKPIFDHLPMRARRKSAPGPGDYIMPRDEQCHAPRASWQDEGLRQLAAENRELKQRTAHLETEYQRIAQLAVVAQSPPAVAVVDAAVAEAMSGFAEMD